MFVVIEGIDGAGKTTFAKMLVNELNKLNLNYTHTRQPGGCDSAENIRTLIKENVFTDFTDLMLMFASRYESLRNTILPALKRKEIVVCERYNDSTYAYQVFESISNLNDTFNYLEDQINIITKPDLVIYLESDVNVSKKRINDRGEPIDRFETDIFFQRKCQRGFNFRISQNKYNYVVIPPQESMDSLFKEVDKIVKDFFYN